MQSALLEETRTAVELTVPKISDPFQKAALLLLGDLVHAIERGTQATCELRDSVTDLTGSLCGEERDPGRAHDVGLAEVIEQLRGGLIVEIDKEGE